MSSLCFGDGCRVTKTIWTNRFQKRSQICTMMRIFSCQTETTSQWNQITALVSKICSFMFKSPDNKMKNIPEYNFEYECISRYNCNMIVTLCTQREFRWKIICLNYNIKTLIVVPPISRKRCSCLIYYWYLKKIWKSF